MQFNSLSSSGSVVQKRVNPKAINVQGVDSATVVYTVPKGKILEGRVFYSGNSTSTNNTTVYINGISMCSPNTYYANGSGFTPEIFMTEGDTISMYSGQVTMSGIEYDV